MRIVKRPAGWPWYHSDCSRLPTERQIFLPRFLSKWSVSTQFDTEKNAFAGAYFMQNYNPGEKKNLATGIFSSSSFFQLCLLLIIIYPLKY